MQLRAAMFDKRAQAAVRHDDRCARLRVLPDGRGARRRRSRSPRIGTAAPAKSATSTSRDWRPAGGRCPFRVHRDNFKIEGCPVNGPAIAARGKDVVVAWFTAPNEMNRSYLAFSHDGGRTFGAPVRADDEESLGRVVVALEKSGSRDRRLGGVAPRRRRQFQIRRVQPNGTRSAAVAVANQSGTRYPRMALARDEVVLAWTESEQESSRVKTRGAPASALLTACRATASRPTCARGL